MDSDGKNFELLLKNTSMGNAKAQYDMDARAINYATISEKEFQSAEARFFVSCERADVRFAWLMYHADTYGDDWLSADDETIKERLLNSYRAFADAETEER